MEQKEINIHGLEEAAKEHSFNAPSYVYEAIKCVAETDLTNTYLKAWKREVETALIAGAKWDREQCKSQFLLLAEWFDDIAEKCAHLTSGNVSHNGAAIRGYAKNCSEYIKSTLL